MSFPTFLRFLVGAAALAVSSNAPAQGTVRAPGTSPRPAPQIARPMVDPHSQDMSALSLKVDALRASVGRQVVVLHFTPTEMPGWLDADNSFPKNTARAEDICKDALGDRYGRVLSRKPMMNFTTNRWFFPHVVCETAP